MKHKKLKPNDEGFDLNNFTCTCGYKTNDSDCFIVHLRDGRDFKFCMTCKAMTPRRGDGTCWVCEESSDDKKEETNNQLWTCSFCGNQGTVPYTDGENPKSVLAKIIRDHREAASYCHGSASGDLKVHDAKVSQAGIILPDDNKN